MVRLLEEVLMQLTFAGIGKATAGALANKGFNLVLHGRNEKKLQTVKADLQRQFPARSFKTLVLDATNIDAGQLEAAVDSIKDINLKVLINNVGGLANLDPLWQTLGEMSLVDINCIIDLNITFATLLTRLLLPQLRQAEPALIMNVGSGSSEFPGIYSTVYSGTKAFIKTFSDALDAEAGVEGWKIESIGLIVGPVITESLEKSGMKTSLTQPGPQHFAKSILHVVGGGYRVVYPYWAHRALFAFILCLPRRSQISMLLDIGKGMRQKKKSD